MSDTVHNTDMFRDGRFEITTLTDALSRLIQGYQSNGKMAVGSGWLGQGTQIMIVVGKTEDVAPILMKANLQALGVKIPGV